MDHTKQQLLIAEIEPVTPAVNRYRLVSAVPGGTPAPFLPGQYLCLYYNINGSTVSRPYSIASSPWEAAEGGYYDLYIHGGGSFTSSWLFAHADVGTSIQASLPLGEFCIKPTTSRHIIGISGGMSVTPLRSMARSVADSLSDCDMTLFCGWDRAEDLLFREEFLRLSEQCGRLRVHFAVAQDNVLGTLHGYFTGEEICSKAETENAEFFLCGPEPMYRSLRLQLAGCRIPPERYHQELPGEIHQPPYPVKVAKCYPLTVRCGKNCRTVSANAGETVLVALERAGLSPLAYCRSGTCGFCSARLLSGEIWSDPVRSPGEDGTHGDCSFHPCCAFPLSSLTVDLPER